MHGNKMKKGNLLTNQLSIGLLMTMLLLPMPGFAIALDATSLLGSLSQIDTLLDELDEAERSKTEDAEFVETLPREVGEEPSRIEQLVESSRSFDVENFYSSKEPLKQYGYDLFASNPVTFAPVSDAPIPSNYIIGPGDSVNILLFGSISKDITRKVTRNGYLHLPGLGPVPVAGLSFAELKENLLERIANQMIGVKASISLGELRTIRIFALGNVQKPGSYTLSALSTLTNAIFSSGGIKRIGTLRNIQLKRNGKVISNFDLYDLLLNGDTSKDRRLLPGDVVFVPPIGPTVSILGAVHRPAIYELTKSSRSLEQVLSMSGGVMPTASLSSTIIQTINPKQKASVFTIDLTSNKGKAYQVNNGDMVIIQHRILYKGGSILLSGEVKSPGIYPIAPGEKLSSVIQRAGGFTEAAYLEGSVFTRERLKKLESVSINNALDQLEKDLILSQTKIKAIQATRNVAAIQGVINKMRETSEPMGRMAISLGKIHDDDFDVLLSHGDTLHVPTIPQEVTVIGEVNHPTSHLFDSSYDVDKYINRSGGLKKNADYSQIYVIKASGTVALASNSDKGFFRKDSQISITRGDTIVVPLDAETATPMEVLNSVTKITSQIAITLASFKTFGIF